MNITGKEEILDELDKRDKRKRTRRSNIIAYSQPYYDPEIMNFKIIKYLNLKIFYCYFKSKWKKD
jgi:hypothetical protein